MRHAAAARQPGQGKVLVVDDEPMVLEIATILLEGEGFVVSTARSAVGLSDVLAREAPDVVLLDVGLPGLKGHLAVQAVRACSGGERTRVILYSGECEEELQEMAARTGADGTLAKASAPAQLVETVQRAMRAERGIPAAKGVGHGAQI
jgi:two-component system KDP operon response regulator KdpE